MKTLPYITMSEAADRLGVSFRCIGRLLDRGDLAGAVTADGLRLVTAAIRPGDAPPPMTYRKPGPKGPRPGRSNSGG